MIVKQPDISGINPVARIMPVLAVETIGSTTQELGDRATQFVKGQEYLAQVLSKVGDTAYNVKVDGVILKMELGTAAQAGQTLLLRYMQDSPVPTFFLAPMSSSNAGTTTDLSPAAHLIGQYLQEAEGAGASTRYEAAVVVSHSPKNTQVMAQDLKHAVTNSGLFYESHLSELVQGSRTLASVMQEPQNQNQSSSPLAALVSQQLALLENQSMAWHGEVWPGQKMSWDVYLQQRDTAGTAGQQASSEQQAEARPIASELTLHLPHMGKVSARLSLIDGRLSLIHI